MSKTIWAVATIASKKGLFYLPYQTTVFSQFFSHSVFLEILEKFIFYNYHLKQ